MSNLFIHMHFFGFQNQHNLKPASRRSHLLASSTALSSTAASSMVASSSWQGHWGQGCPRSRGCSRDKGRLKGRGHLHKHSFWHPGIGLAAASSWQGPQGRGCPQDKGRLKGRGHLQTFGILALAWNSLVLEGSSGQRLSLGPLPSKSTASFTVAAFK